MAGGCGWLGWRRRERNERLEHRRPSWLRFDRFRILPNSTGRRVRLLRKGVLVNMLAP